MKTPVIFHDFQEWPNHPPMALVHLPSRSTVQYDPKKHRIVNTDELYDKLEKLGKTII